MFSKLLNREEGVVPALSIVIVSMAAAIFYGLVHDQITVRICLEYFTIGHPRIIESESPTVLGIVWGIVATWWVGFILGIGLAGAARLGGRPKLKIDDLLRPMVRLMLVMGFVASVSGLIGYCLFQMGVLTLLGRMGEQVPVDQHLSFVVVLWIHLGSYLSALIGGVVLWRKTWKRRSN